MTKRKPAKSRWHKEESVLQIYRHTLQQRVLSVSEGIPTTILEKEIKTMQAEGYELTEWVEPIFHPHLLNVIFHKVIPYENDPTEKGC